MFWQLAVDLGRLGKVDSANMGTCGTAIFSDDFASDVRQEFRELLAETQDVAEVVRKLEIAHKHSLKDIDEKPVFWLSLAATAWKLGRLDENLKRCALEIIEDGSDLRRWNDDPQLKRKRARVLEKLAEQLRSKQRSPVKISKPWVAKNEWGPGEVLGLRLRSGKWTLIHVTGHHEDKGGRHAVCQLLDWVGVSKPTDPNIPNCIAVIEAKSKWLGSEFILEEPRKKADKARIGHWDLMREKPFKLTSWLYKSKEMSGRGQPLILWSNIDESLLEYYGLSHQTG